MRVLVTGAAGFIGSFAAQALLARGDEVVGADNLCDYYDPALKRARLKRLEGQAGFRFVEVDLADGAATLQLFEKARATRVLHLAAQAGVRYSIANPHAYVQSNLVGFTNVLEACRLHAVEHLVYASSSSVYGGNRRLPFAEADAVDHPVSFYGATKKANELFAHTYSHVHRLPTTGLRYFTVYGPWGRPDMSPLIFAHAIMQGKPIEVFNQGQMARDFTYVDDIVAATLRVLDQVATGAPDYDPYAPDAATSDAPYRIYNVGNHAAVGLTDYIDALEQVLGRTAQRIMRPMQPGDVEATYADIARVQRAVGFAPATPLAVGLAAFADWFFGYYGYPRG